MKDTIKKLVDQLILGGKDFELTTNQTVVQIVIEEDNNYTRLCLSENGKWWLE